MVEVECGGFIFTSNFESGNLARVEHVNLLPKPPAPAATPAPNGTINNCAVILTSIIYLYWYSNYNAFFFFSAQPSSNNALETPDYEFNIWTNPDCAGTEFENGNRSWFYFGIRGTKIGMLK